MNKNSGPVLACALAISCVTPVDSAYAQDFLYFDLDLTPKTKLLLIQGNVYLVTGIDRNVTVQIGDDVVIVIDPHFGQLEDTVLSAIRQVTQKPARYFVNSPVQRSHDPRGKFIPGETDLFYSGEEIRIIRIPRAHTGEDRIVFFLRSDVISTGDVFVNTYPIIDVPTAAASMAPWTRWIA